MYTPTKLTTTADTLLHTVTTGKRFYFSVNATPLAAGTFSLAITTGSTPTDADWLEKDLAMEPTTPLERTGLIADAGYKVYAKTDTANAIAVQVYGYEEDA